MKYDQVSDDDRSLIALQLGREARGLLGIGLRCKYGHPQVIVNRPVSIEIADINVFPTLFWLTCPYLRKAVARLESEGWIALENVSRRMKSLPQGLRQIMMLTLKNASI